MAPTWRLTLLRHIESRKLTETLAKTSVILRFLNPRFLSKMMHYLFYIWGLETTLFENIFSHRVTDRQLQGLNSRTVELLFCICA
jgi:hypothetical protein